MPRCSPHERQLQSSMMSLRCLPAPNAPKPPNCSHSLGPGPAAAQTRAKDSTARPPRRPAHHGARAGPARRRCRPARPHSRHINLPARCSRPAHAEVTPGSGRDKARLSCPTRCLRGRSPGALRPRRDGQHRPHRSAPASWRQAKKVEGPAGAHGPRAPRRQPCQAPRASRSRAGHCRDPSHVTREVAPSAEFPRDARVRRGTAGAPGEDRGERGRGPSPAAARTERGGEVGERDVRMRQGHCALSVPALHMHSGAGWGRKCGWACARPSSRLAGPGGGSPGGRGGVAWPEGNMCPPCRTPSAAHHLPLSEGTRLDSPS